MALVYFDQSDVVSSKVHLFSTVATGTAPSASSNSNAYGVYFSSSEMEDSFFAVFDGSLSVTSAEGPAALFFFTTRIGDTTVSTHGTALSVVANADPILLFVDSDAVVDSTVEFIGGTATVTNTGSGNARVIQLASDSGTIRFHGTKIMCESSLESNVFTLASSDSVENTIVAVYDGEVVLKGADTRLWSVESSAATVSAQFIFSHSKLEFEFTGSYDVVYKTGTSQLQSTGALFWHHSTYTLNGGQEPDLTAAYDCNGNCVDLTKYIDDDTNTPLMPVPCANCLAPLGELTPFDDGSKGDYAVHDGECFLAHMTTSAPLVPTTTPTLEPTTSLSNAASPSSSLGLSKSDTAAATASLSPAASSSETLRSSFSQSFSVLKSRSDTVVATVSLSLASTVTEALTAASSSLSQSPSNPAPSSSAGTHTATTSGALTQSLTVALTVTNTVEGTPSASASATHSLSLAVLTPAASVALSIAMGFFTSAAFLPLLIGDPTSVEVPAFVAMLSAGGCATEEERRAASAARYVTLSPHPPHVAFPLRFMHCGGAFSRGAQWAGVEPTTNRIFFSQNDERGVGPCPQHLV